MADYSKAFDTVKFHTVLEKMNSLGFSKTFPQCIVNYPTNRKHLVQKDDKRSELSMVSFGVPQGSIMGPLVFNIYVSDLQASIEQSSDLTCHQYTTFYVHCKPINLRDGVSSMNATIEKLDKWSRDVNLVLNPSKTKGMLISTQQLAISHSLNKADVDLNVNNNHIDCVDKTKLLGTFTDHLNRMSTSNISRRPATQLWLH